MNTPFSQEQLIARELEKLQASVASDSGDGELTDKQIYDKLKAPFPKDAYSCDSSRGFNLTSIKAQYVIERLNDVLGIMNWSHGGEYETIADGGVIFKGALIITINGKQNRFFATGYAGEKKNVGDMYKSAKTDSLSKCASQIGVGNEVFKGLIDPKTFENVLEKNATKTQPATVATAKTQTVATETKTEEVPSMFKLKSSQKVSTTATKKGL